MRSPPLLAGLELTAPNLPDDAAVLTLPRPRLLPDPLAAIERALEHPEHGPPLSARVGPGSRVSIVVPPPASLVPRGEFPVLRAALRAVVRVLRQRNVPDRRVRILVANGLEPRPSRVELGAALGVEHTGALTVETFDAEANQGHRPFADGQGGAQLLARALGEASLVVDVSVRAAGSQPPLHNLVFGLAAADSARALFDPAATAEALDARARRRAQALAAALPLFSVSVVQGEVPLAPALQALIRGSGLTAPARAWDRLPLAVRRKLAQAYRGGSSPAGIFAGEPLRAEAGAQALARALGRVADGPPCDVLVIPVPALSPDAPNAQSNPVLDAHQGMVTLLARARHRLRAGGAVVLASPLHESFGRARHLPMVEFYERVLRLATRPQALSARFERELGGRPEYVAAYQRRGAMHGALPFFRWYALERARAGVPVYAAGAGAAAAQRVGLIPCDATGALAHAVAAAIAQAGADLGHARPRVAVLDVLQLAR